MNIVWLFVVDLTLVTSNDKAKWLEFLERDEEQHKREGKDENSILVFNLCRIHIQYICVTLV